MFCVLAFGVGPANARCRAVDRIGCHAFDSDNESSGSRVGANALGTRPTASCEVTQLVISPAFQSDKSMMLTSPDYSVGARRG